jgi:hypothetical protein
MTVTVRGRLAKTPASLSPVEILSKDRCLHHLHAESGHCVGLTLPPCICAAVIARRRHEDKIIEPYYQIRVLDRGL